jgi:hypothetical protein
MKTLTLIISGLLLLAVLGVAIQACPDDPNDPNMPTGPEFAPAFAGTTCDFVYLLDEPNEPERA